MMSDNKLLRLSATLIFAGFLFFFIVGLFHTDRANPNDHVAAFTDYAASQIWTAVHLGQFIGMTIIIVGVLGLFSALDNRSIISQLGIVFALMTLSLYGVLQAVDGVALKQAVDAWVSAPDAEKAARFASAEVVRWAEWGVRSYQSFLLGITFILLAALIVQTAKVSRLIGYLAGLSGLAYFMQGWIIGSTGFSVGNTIPTLIGYATTLIWSVWLLIGAWRMKVE